jgi:hypothetical protein
MRSFSAAGPRNLSEVELGEFGLGVVVRLLRGVAVPLRRVYCRLCGIAVDHDPGAAGWWFCRNDCNAREPAR